MVNEVKEKCGSPRGGFFLDKGGGYNTSRDKNKGIINFDGGHTTNTECYYHRPTTSLLLLGYFGFRLRAPFSTLIPRPPMACPPGGRAGGGGDQDPFPPVRRQRAQRRLPARPRARRTTGSKAISLSTGLLTTVPPKKIISLISPLGDLILGKALFLFLFFAFVFLLWVQDTYQKTPLNIFVGSFGGMS